MPNEFDSEEQELPAFQSGGRVRETGLAVVHEGEYIMPAPGSEVDIEPAEMTGQGVINYYFPVEIVVVGALSDEDHDAVQARVWEKLSDAMQRLA